MSPEVKTLIEILATVDSLHWPSRERFIMRVEQVLRERRRQYVETGLPITGGGAETERQAHGRRLGVLAATGLVTIIKQAGRRVGCRLTPLGDAVARRLCGVFTVADSWPVLELCKAWQALLPSWPEHLLCGIEEWAGTDDENEALALMRQRLVPVLAAGYVSATGDTDDPRRYWMSLTDAGRAALEAGPPEDAPVAIEFSQDAADEYDREWARAQKSLQDGKPDHPADLAIPVPCGCGWGSLAAAARGREASR